MDTRSILLIAAAAFLLISHGGELWGLLRSAGGGVASLVRGKRADPVTPPDEVTGADDDVRPGVEDRVRAFRIVKPFMTTAEASAAWARLEPEGPTLEAPKP